MAIGTGLPIPKRDVALAQPARLVRDDFGASDWAQIGNSFGRLAEVGADQLERDATLQKAAFLADTENREKAEDFEAAKKFENDPQGYQAWARGRVEGTIAQAPSWARPQIKSFLGREQQKTYESISIKKQGQDRQLAAQSLNDRLKMADTDIMGLAMAGKMLGPDGKATKEYQLAVDDYNGVLKTQVSERLISQEHADLMSRDVSARAQGEEAARSSLKVYEDDGFDKAVDHLRKGILENDKLDLKPADRSKIFNRGVQQLRLQKAQEAGDREEARRYGNELLERIKIKDDISPAEVNDAVVALNKAGSPGLAMRLTRDYHMAQAKAPMANMTIGEQGRYVGGLRRGAAPPASMAGVFETAARATGVSVQDLVSRARVESGFNPNARSGSYKGIFQMSDAEFQKHGGGDIYNTMDNIMAGARKAAADNAEFRRDFGRDPTATESYLIHQQGAAGFRAHAANPDRPAWQNMLSTGEGRQKGEKWAKTAIWGNIPDDVKKQFPGGVEDVTSAQFMGVWDRKLGGGGPIGPAPGTGIRSALAAPIYRERGIQAAEKELAAGARKSWPALQGMMNRGQQPTTEDLAGVLSGAQLTGDPNFQAEVEAGISSFALGERGGLSQAERGSLLEQVRREMSAGGFTIDEAALDKKLTEDYERRVKAVADDPVRYATERFGYGQVPLDLSNPAGAIASTANRVALARFTAESEQVPLGSPFGETERKAIAGAIASGDPKRSTAAWEAINSVPDEFLAATLEAGGMKEAIGGAARSNDPVKFGQAMTYIGGMYQRAPDLTARVLGEQVMKDMKFWESRGLYMSPEELTKELTQAKDPVASLRRAEKESEGRAAFAKRPGDLLEKFDTTYWTPGDTPRMQMTGPMTDVESTVRDRFLGDASDLFGHFYARFGGDADEAERQTIDLMKRKWSRSEVNGGRLMLNAPEKVYEPFGLSPGYMRSAIEADLAAELGPRRDPASNITGAFMTNWDYNLVADRQTATEVGRRDPSRPPSYLVVVENHRTGERDVLRRADGTVGRFWWDVNAGKAARDETFRQKETVAEQAIVAPDPATANPLMRPFPGTATRAGMTP